MTCQPMNKKRALDLAGGTAASSHQADKICYRAQGRRWSRRYLYAGDRFATYRFSTEMPEKRYGVIHGMSSMDVINECHQWISVMDVIHGCHPWMSSMAVISGCHPWTASMNVIHGCHLWKSSTDVNHGYYPWMSSMDVNHACHPWMTSMDVIHGYHPWLHP